MYMTQLNLHLQPEFERDLIAFMRTRGIKTKAEAVRIAVRESLARARAGRPSLKRLARLRGAALKAPLNPEPRFSSDDSLWRR